MYLSPLATAAEDTQQFHFYDSNAGKRLFTAPVHRTLGDFLDESRAHGWPKCRDPGVRTVLEGRRNGQCGRDWGTICPMHRGRGTTIRHTTIGTPTVGTDKQTQQGWSIMVVTQRQNQLAIDVQNMQCWWPPRHAHPPGPPSLMLDRDWRIAR